ncbi:uncharacterized protein LODBEIA_P24090 [Lodderomyces beijingensis]|uniref:Trafficking protein particle complex subunit n=1 Tax=Lodderomyces beijingensis TaxID=1775926 RepID=A0ABP0ZJ71_9ASCO
MAIYSFFIFDRHCNCIYDREFFQSSASTIASSSASSTTSIVAATSSAKEVPVLKGQVNKNNDANSSKLLFGILYSLKTIAVKLMDGSGGGGEDSLQQANELKQFTMGQFKVHFWESLTKFKFVIISDLKVVDLQSVLWQLYSNYFMTHVVENSLSPIEFKWIDEQSAAGANSSREANEYSGKISNSKFIEETDKYLQSLPAF